MDLNRKPARLTGWPTSGGIIRNSRSSVENPSWPLYATKIYIPLGHDYQGPLGSPLRSKRPHRFPLRP